MKEEEKKNTENQIQNSAEDTVGKSRRSDENLAKIAITKEADRALTEILGRVNEGFEAGKASKQDLTSQIVMHFSKNYTDNDLHAIRVQFFNPIALMEVVLRKAKETGYLPDTMRELLYQQFIASSNPQLAAKKPKKPLRDNAINESIKVEEGAA